MNKEMIISSNGHETHGGHPRGRSGRGDLRRARAAPRRRRQRLQGPGLESPARHAVLVHRPRPRARRLPLRRRRHRHPRGVRQARRRRGRRRGAGQRRRKQRRRRRTSPRARSPGPPDPEDRGAAQGRPGDRRPGRQGAARHQGRAPDLARDDAGPVPGVHADRRSHRRVAQDRIARGARPAARHRPRVPRGARLHRRRDHPHRGRRPPEGRHPRRPRGLPQDLDRDAAAQRVVARAGGAVPGAEHRRASCCAIC